MKRVMGMGLAALVMGMAGEAQAAPNAKDWTLEIRVDNQLGASAVLKAKTKVALEYKYCAMSRGAYVASPFLVSSTGGVATAAYGVYDSALNFIAQAVDPQLEVKCTTDKQLTAATKWDSIEVVVNAPTGVIRTPIILAPERYSTQLNPWAKSAFEKLGGIKSCEAFNTAVPGQEKGLECTASLRSDGQFSVSMTEKMTRGRVEITLGDGKTVAHFGVDACRFRAVGPIPVLVAGAVTQQMSLDVADAEAALRCWIDSNEITQLKVGDVALDVEKFSDFGDVVSGVSFVGPFHVKHIPATLPVGLHEFKIVGNQGTIGTAMIEVVPPIEVGKKLTVAYDLSKSGSIAIHPYQSFFDQITVNDDGIAVENPLGSDVYDRLVVANTASLTISPKIPVSKVGTWEALASDAKVALDTQDADYAVDDAMMVWAVSTGGKTTSFADSTALYNRNPVGAYGGYRMLEEGPEHITFDVLSGTPGPIRRKLALLRVVRFRKNDPTKTILANRLEPVLEVDITLAEKTRQESVPLPLRDEFVVQCGVSDGDKARHGHSYAVESDDIKAEQCVLKFDENKPLAKLEDLRKLFGPQRIVTKVKGAGADGKEQVAPVDIKDAVGFRIILHTHTADSVISGAYEVEAKINATREDRVHYRGTSPDKAAAIGIMQDTRLTFATTLRPRGALDYKAGFRFYMTAFLPVSGLRLPAATSELRSSASYPNIQFVSPKVGLLLGWEPFNHDLGKNPFGLQPTMQMGMNLISLADTSIVPTFIVGPSFTIPVLEEATAKLGSKVTLGAYYELDPRVSNEYAHHFLLTLGLNIGTLLSSSPR